MPNTAAATEVHVRRGNGAAVHFATTMDGRVVGTRCATNVNYNNVLRLRQTTDAVTCKSCLRIG